MTNQISKSNSEIGKADERPATARKFDLEERTACFAKAIIRFAKRIPVTPVTESIIRQMVKSGTSIGANYGKANDAESKKDFRHKIGICRKEAKETKYWLPNVAEAVPELAQDARVLWQEAKELNLIFSKIFRESA